MLHFFLKNGLKMGNENKKKVLLIDDEHEVIDFFRERFSEVPEVLFMSAERPEEGIELARREKPDVILMDLRMPKINGETAIRMLRPELPGTRFVVITGCGDDDIRARIEKEIQVAAFYDKPLDCDMVLAKVFELIGRG
jgi:DNA-binding NarL/FixJ family response regulator